MNWFRKPKLRPLIEEPEPIRKTGDRLEWIAEAKVHVGIGLKMLSAQAANEALRHCRIGMVRCKA
jgi:hypothetical protein